jgi:predicted RNA-binding Zn-ribbon protein involved in translation (DUF1610 family)
MWLPLLVAALILTAGILVGLGRSAASRTNAAPAAGAHAARPTRAELAARLAKLAATPTKTDLEPGAMCYSPVPRPTRAEYLCPACGNKTVYSINQAETVQWTLPRCRRLVPQLATLLDVSFDERAFCAKCRPAGAAVRPFLEIRHPGETAPHRVAINGEDDFKLLITFLQGETVYRTWNDGEAPLQARLDRLRELLGISGP